MRSGQRLNVYFWRFAPRPMPQPSRNSAGVPMSQTFFQRRREPRVRVGGHAPQREDEHPPVDHEAAPEQLEADVLVDQVVGVELDALEDEVVEHVEREERRIEENAGVRVRAEALVVVRGAREGVQREHRPADDVEVHLHVEAVAEERHLPRPPVPERKQRILLLPFGGRLYTAMRAKMVVKTVPPATA